VELWIKSGQLKVKDPDLAADKRAEVQKTMEGPAVLDVQRFPEIHFRSTAVKAAANHWTVLGNLELHGRTQPVTVEVSEDNGRYRGSASFKQTDFGIPPVSVAGGTVKVKDNVKMEFDIVLSR
jgi:polyisoprenoid-binding protein YceI